MSITTKNSVITITFGEVSITHIGMEEQGNMLSSGLRGPNLKSIITYFEKTPVKVEVIKLHDVLEKKDIPEGHTVAKAYLIIARQAVDYLLQKKQKTTSDLHTSLTKHTWDKKYYDVRRSKVLNKRARYNITYGDNSQEADFDHGKGSIVAWKEVPLLNYIRKSLNNIVRKKMNLKAEGNFYHDAGKKNSGIGYGDAERKIVIALRTGCQNMPFHYQWYYQGHRVGKNIQVDIHPGDIYFMSEKATGNDWKKRNTLSLRHATGASKYTN